MNPEDEFQPEEQKPKHSRYDIASFAISIVNGLVICCFLIVAAEIGGWGMHIFAEVIWGFVMLIFIVLFTGLIPLVGLVLGLVGLRQQNFRKQFCKLGIGLNGIHLFLGMTVFLLWQFGIVF